MAVARASLEELLLDYKDFLRQRRLPLWGKDHPRALQVRSMAYQENRSYLTYRSYVEDHAIAASPRRWMVVFGEQLPHECPMGRGGIDLKK